MARATREFQVFARNGTYFSGIRCTGCPQLSTMGGKSLSRQGYHDLKSSFPVCRANRASESFDGFLGDGQTQS